MSDLLVKKQITNKRRYYSGTNPCRYITIHETANTRVGADAQAHANLQSKCNVRVASWQWQVDDQEAIQSYENHRQCWHAGDGRGNGNTASIGIEICENRDGDYKQAVRNAALLTAQLMKEHGISITDIRQHNNWSGKDCPNDLRHDNKGYSWPEFLTLVVDAHDGKLGNLKPVKPKPGDKLPDGVDEQVVVDGYWGTDVTTELQYIFGTPIDGEVWYQSKAWKDDNPGLTWGWKWVDHSKSSPLIEAVQKWAGLKGDDVDGRIGPVTISAIQRKLRKMGYYKNSVDGQLWAESATIKGLQRAINDGKIK